MTWRERGGQIYLWPMRKGRGGREEGEEFTRKVVILSNYRVTVM